MKKSLLTESEIRKFMKFADITPLTENFLDRVQEETVTEEEAVTEEETVTEQEAVAEETVTEEVLTEEDVDVHDLVTALMDVIEDKTGVQVTVEKDAEGAEGIEGAEDLDAGLEEPAGDEMEPVPGEEEAAVEPSPEMGDEEGAPPEEEEDLMPEAYIQEVVRRVATRLLKENKK